jgi:hypothetical protein
VYEFVWSVPTVIPVGWTFEGLVKVKLPAPTVSVTVVQVVKPLTVHAAAGEAAMANGTAATANVAKPVLRVPKRVIPNTITETPSQVKD